MKAVDKGGGYARQVDLNAVPLAGSGDPLNCPCSRESLNNKKISGNIYHSSCITCTKSKSAHSQQAEGSCSNLFRVHGRDPQYRRRHQRDILLCSKNAPRTGQWAIPERGVVEVKSPANSISNTVGDEQATRYWNRYRPALVTNYWEFILIGEDNNSKLDERESFSLVDNEQAFWAMAGDPVKAVRPIGNRFREFLQRTIMNLASLTQPEDLSYFLASYARAT